MTVEKGAFVHFRSQSMMPEELSYSINPFCLNLLDYEVKLSSEQEKYPSIAKGLDYGHPVPIARNKDEKNSWQTRLNLF